MSSPHDEAEAVTAVYDALHTGSYAAVASAVLLLWDIVLCLDMEIQLVWQNPKSIASLLYILNRYFPLIDGFLTIATFPSMSDESCLALGWSIVVIGVFMFLGPAVFAVLRIYALSGRNKSLSGITLLLSLAPFLINLCTRYNFRIVNHPPPINCSASGSYGRQTNIILTLLWRISAILADLMVIAATWRASYRNLRVLQEISGRPSLHQVLLQNGSLYFCVLLSFNILDITLQILQITYPAAVGQGSYVNGFIDPLTSILISRFVLDLRYVDQMLCVGGTSVSLRSIHFAGADMLSANPQTFLTGTSSPTTLSGYDEDSYEMAGGSGRHAHDKSPAVASKSP